MAGLVKHVRKLTDIFINIAVFLFSVLLHNSITHNANKHLFFNYLHCAHYHDGFFVIFYGYLRLNIFVFLL